MKKHTRRKPSLLKKLRRLVAYKPSRNMHKMYPESYFERTYISKIDALRRNFFAEYFGITKKAALSELIALGIQHFQAGLVNKDLEARLNPEIQEQHAVKFRKYKAIRHYGRLLGWDLKKLSLFLRPKK